MSEYFRKYIKHDNYPISPSRIRFKTFFTNCIPATMIQREYTQTEDDDWTIYWCQKQFIPETLDKIRYQNYRKLNHFRNFYEICRKDLLSKNIKKYRRALEKESKIQDANQYNYTPLTYNLPSQYSIFFEEFKRQRSFAQTPIYWIMKPIGRSQGKGIFIFQRMHEIAEWADETNRAEPYIVQRYLTSPLLIGHKKFDLRIYVLVVAHTPLTIYLYRSGFGRFTHYRYEMSDITNLESHLTNVAIQKNTDNYDEEKGGKYQLDRLKLYFRSKFPSDKVEQCFYNIQQIVIRTLIATSKVMIIDKRCFELYGFDVMIDSQLKPWLIQVNGSPSFTATTPTDERLKKGLLDDALTVVNMQGILSGEEEQIGGFDLVYKNGKRYKKNSKDVSMLGCLNNRTEQMRKLAKSTAIRLMQKQKKKQEEKKQQKEEIRRNRIFTNTNPMSNSTNYQKNSHSFHKEKDNSIKLPKVTNVSTQFIETKKNTQNMLRLTRK